MDPGNTIPRLPLDVEGSPPSSKDPYFTKSKPDSHNTGRQDGEKGSHLRGPDSTVFYLKDIPCTKEGRLISPSDRSNRAEQLHRVPPVCNDQPTHTTQDNRRPMLDGHPGHQRRLLTCPHPTKPPQIPSPNLQPEALFFSDTTVRFDHFSQNVHFHHEASASAPALNRCQRNNLFGRPLRVGPLSGSPPHSRQQSYIAVRETWVHSELGKIVTPSSKQAELARSRLAPTRGCSECSPYLGSRNQQYGDKNEQRAVDHPPAIRMLAGKDSLRQSVFPSKPPPRSSNIEASVDSTPASRRCTETHSSPVVNGAAELEGSEKDDVSVTSAQTHPRNDSMDGRLAERMGLIHIDRLEVPREMVTDSEEPSHQSIGAVSRPINHEEIAPTPISPGDVRQQDHSGRNQPHRLQVPRDSSLCVVPVSSSVGNGSALGSSPHPGRKQHSSRSPLKGQSSGLRVGTSSGEFSSLRRSSRIAGSRSILNSIEPQDANFCCALCSSKGFSNKCLHARLEPVQKHLPVSTTECHSTGTGEATPFSRPRGFNSPKETNSPVVSSTPEERPPPRPTPPSLSDSGRNQVRTRTTEVRSLDRISFLRLLYNNIYPTNVVEALLASYRKSSNRQFEAGWRSFQNWLPRDLEIIEKRTVMEFLVFLREQKFSHHTALSYRNALKLPMDLGFGIKVSDKEFDLLSRSHFLCNPPKPKIIPNWDLDEAMTALESKGIISSLPEEQAFMGSLLIIAVASGNRASELANLDRSAVSFAPDNRAATLAVLPGFLYKNQTPSHTPGGIKIPAMDTDSVLCPVKAIRHILSLPNPKSLQQLFLNPSSGAALNASTLAFWICKAINWLLPGSIPRSHDVRKNTWSTAWVRGVPANEIMNQGFWSSTSIFFRRYFNPNIAIPNTRFVNAGSSG